MPFETSSKEVSAAMRLVAVISLSCVVISAFDPRKQLGANQYTCTSGWICMYPGEREKLLIDRADSLEQESDCCL